LSPAKKHDDAGDWGRALQEVAPYLGIGTSLAATVLAGLGAGYWADTRLATKPVGLLVGGVFGIAVALYQFFRTVSRK
jgi:F0F1-type ATP synthase assembly protein I